MSMERRRKQLMAQQVEWGDSPSPPALSKQVNWGSESSLSDRDPQTASQSGSDSREPSTEASSGDGDDDLEARDAPLLAPVPDDLIMAGRETRKKPVYNPQDILTCKDWTLDSLISKSTNFHRVPRVRWSETKHTARQIKRHEDANPGGVPLVVEGLHNHPGWLRDKFTPEWFMDNGPDTISVRNVHDRSDSDITLSDFIARTRAISPFKTRNERERLYGKDVACPPRWNQFLSSGVIPPYLAPDAPENLLNNLPESVRPETLMCYIGVGDTFTPCHKGQFLSNTQWFSLTLSIDLCASSGHNLMCYTEKGGSSFWFMTATSSANAAAEYLQNKLNQVLDHEAHVITVEELAQAPFDIYITEQKLGDLVLVPPRSMHQVVNNGGITIKTSWSRMTLDGLSLALRYELPLYRRVCRAEIYRVKATIYHTLLKTAKTVSDLLCTQADSRNAVASTSHQDMPTQLDALLRLLLLFDSILIEEYSPGANNMRQLADPDKTDEESEQIACDFCGADIFLSFFECRSCVSGGRRAEPGGGFHICPGCYVEGRTCACEVMSPVQCRYVDKLFKARARAVDLFRVCSELVHRRSDSVLSNQELRTDGRLGLFRAAIVLRKRRLEMSKAGNLDQSRRCTVKTKKEHNHDTPIPWMLQCQKCHSGSCFAHMVWSSQLHSAEASLANEKDVSGAALHEAHLTSKMRFSSEIVTLKREDPDYVPDLRVQLAYLATAFSTCRPINPNPKLWKAGHYDLKAWEIGLPNRKIASEMRVGPPKKVASHPVSKSHKRLVFDCVFVTPVSRPAKRKDRAGKPVSTIGRNEPQAGDQADDDDHIPMRKRRKSTRPPRGPPGIPHSSSSSSLQRPAAAARPSCAKNVILIDTTAVSDSEDERPLKRRRVNSKPAADLRFQTRDPQPASSVADAFNTAYAQNSRAIPNTVARQSPSSASASAPLPRRKPKQKADAVSPAGSASSSSEGSNSFASPPGLQDTLAAIMETLSTVKEAQAKQAAEVREIRRAYEGHAPEVISDSTAAIERQSLSTETTVKVVADLVNGLVSALHPSALHPQLPAASSSSHHYQTQPIFVTQSRNWPTMPPSRGRGRGRGSGVAFGDHPYRSTASRDISPEDYHRPARQRQYGHHTAPFPSPARHVDAPVSSAARGGYYEQRIWIPGPHAGQERREERREERVREYAEERREPQEPTRKRRKFTRFSPPNSPENNLELVLSRTSRPLASRISRFEGEETGSDASGTLTNANETAGALQLFRRQTPVGGKSRNEGSSASTEKFFRGLGRSRSPTPLDEQDWETRYAKDVDNT
ncbi:hypothetical protein MVEN_02043400 [Mycena venus]|uniref:JmjC domain-containing protein n=1 Tax=Mycena venus TaxID=2733690 RepID=A0A8H7CI13_9AGAR|nr:hypothetical protein MVEN_02043400 [Mycena venus]